MKAPWYMKITPGPKPNEMTIKFHWLWVLWQRLFNKKKWLRINVKDDCKYSDDVDLNTIKE